MKSLYFKTLIGVINLGIPVYLHAMRQTGRVATQQIQPLIRGVPKSNLYKNHNIWEQPLKSTGGACSLQNRSLSSAILNSSPSKAVQTSTFAPLSSDQKSKQAISTYPGSLWQDMRAAAKEILAETLVNRSIRKQQLEDANKSPEVIKSEIKSRLQERLSKDYVNDFFEEPNSKRVFSPVFSPIEYTNVARGLLLRYKSIGARAQEPSISSDKEFMNQLLDMINKACEGKDPFYKSELLYFFGLDKLEEEHSELEEERIESERRRKYQESKEYRREYQERKKAEDQEREKAMKEKKQEEIQKKSWWDDFKQKTQTASEEILAKIKAFRNRFLDK